MPPCAASTSRRERGSRGCCCGMRCTSTLGTNRGPPSRRPCRCSGIPPHGSSPGCRASPAAFTARLLGASAAPHPTPARPTPPHPAPPHPQPRSYLNECVMKCAGGIKLKASPLHEMAAANRSCRWRRPSSAQGAGLAPFPCHVSGPGICHTRFSPCSPPLLLRRTAAATPPATLPATVRRWQLPRHAASLPACTLQLVQALLARSSCHLLTPLPPPPPLCAASDSGDWDSLSPVCASGLTYMNEAEARVRPRRRPVAAGRAVRRRRRCPPQRRPCLGSVHLMHVFTQVFFTHAGAGPAHPAHTPVAPHPTSPHPTRHSSTATPSPA